MQILSLRAGEYRGKLGADRFQRRVHCLPEKRDTFYRTQIRASGIRFDPTLRASGGAGSSGEREILSDV